MLQWYINFSITNKNIQSVAIIGCGFPITSVNPKHKVIGKNDFLMHVLSSQTFTTKYYFNSIKH